MKKWFALLLASLLAVSAVSCGNPGGQSSAPAESSKTEVSQEASQSGEKSYVKIFDDVEYTTVIGTPAGDVLPDGQTVEDNLRTRLFHKQTGLVTKVIWSASGEACTQKMNMMIASGDLPDYFQVSYSQYMALVKADLLADLTEYYENDLDPAIKEVYASADNADIKAVTRGGKIYGIPKANGLGDSNPILWMRKDWLDALNLEEPKCIGDLEAIAKAFMAKDSGNYGLPILPLFDAADGGTGSVADIFTNYGAFPGQWKVGDDGKVVYGSLTKETEQVLEMLNGWYKEGIIPTDFGSWTGDQYKQAVTSGKAGMCFGQWWLSWSYMTDTVVNDPNTVWTAYALPKEAGQDYVGGSPNAAGSTIGVVSKKCKDPSMFIYALNDIFASMKQPGYSDDIAEAAVVNNAYTPMTIFPLPADAIINTGLLATEYAAGKITLDQVAEKSFPSEAAYNQSMAKAAKVVADSANPYDSMEDWSNSMGYTIGMMAFHNSNANFVASDYSGITDTMQKKQSFLDKLELEAFTKMIMGDTDGKTVAEYFDDFVQQYLAQGGQEITDEVQAEIDAAK